MEFETEFGTVVQCSDMIVQAQHNFVLQKCDPKCENGGVCQNGECVCGKNFEGDHCEEMCKSKLNFDR